MRAFPSIPCDVLALVALAGVTTGQLLGDFALDPRHYVSPSGEYELFVDPSRRSGGGEGKYRFTQGGKELWSGERPWTLWEAEVTDDGLVAGYAYGAGYTGGDDDSLTVVLLDALGKTRLEERTKREGWLSDMGSPEPMVRGLLVDRANGRLIVRVRGGWGRPDADLPETWWAYGLLDGARGPSSQPRQHVPEDRRVGSILAARALPGTGLVLLHWDWVDSDARRFGSMFMLQDRDGEVCWRLDWPSDCTVSGDLSEQYRLWDEIRGHGAILGVEEGGRFTLRQVAKSERVTFEAEHVTGQREGWEVREVARAPFAPKARLKKEAEGAIGQEATLQLRHLGTISLNADHTSSPIHDVMSFGLDGAGRLGVICRSDTRFDFLLLDAEGEVLSTIELPRAPEGSWWAFETVWLGGTRWLVTGSDAGKGGEHAWCLDFTAGSVTAIEGFESPDIDSLTATGDGGFVVLGKEGNSYITNHLVSFGPDGARRWALGGDQGDPADPSTLFSPEAVTVTSDGRVVVLSNIQNLLQVFSKSGEFQGAVDLKKSWGRDPRYPTGVRADLEGGLIVNDFNGEPPIVRMDSAGSVIASFQPRFADGKTFRLRGDVQVSPDGRLWTSDGQALLLLGPDGVVQRFLGNAPDTEALGRVSRLLVGPGDRLHAVDQHTAFVHVFDAAGKLLHVCKPAPDDFSGDLVLPSLTVNDAGEVFLSAFEAKGFVRFDAGGTRQGIERLELDEISQEWHSQPGSTRMWVVGYQTLYLVEADHRIVRSIEHAPDGTWLRELGQAAVAADGSLALVSGGGLRGRPVRLHLFSSAGEPVRSLDLPRAFVTFLPFAFDGRRVVFLEKDGSRGASSVERLDLDDGRLQRLETERSGVDWKPMFAAGGRELWLFDGERRVERYRLE